jgi:hypothetical protein
MVRVGTVLDRYRCFLRSVVFLALVRSGANDYWKLQSELNIRLVIWGNAGRFPVHKSVHLFYRLSSLFPDFESQGVFSHSRSATKRALCVLTKNLYLNNKNLLFRVNLSLIGVNLLREMLSIVIRCLCVRRGKA